MPKQAMETKAAKKDRSKDRSSDTTPMTVNRNHCFGCGPDNRTGLHLHFERVSDEKSVECYFELTRSFEGPPGHVHGGIIATILDETMGHVNWRKQVVALTRQMSIEYLRPVPLATKLHAVGWPVSEHGRKHQNAAEIRTLDGHVLARSEGLFIAIDPATMFDKHERKGVPLQKKS